MLNSLSSVDAQRGYRHAIEEFVERYCSEPRPSFSKTVVLRYGIHLESRHLAPGTINLRLRCNYGGFGFPGPLERIAASPSIYALSRDLSRAIVWGLRIVRKLKASACQIPPNGEALGQPVQAAIRRYAGYW